MDHTVRSTDPRTGTRVMLRPLASPLPLGFTGLAFGTTLLAALQLGWLEASDGRVVALAVLLLTVPLHLLASVLGFLCRDPGAAIAMAVLSGTWAVTGATIAALPPDGHSDALGVALLTAAVALLVAASAEAGKPVAGAVVALAAVRFALTGIAELTASSGWATAAGLTGLLLALLSFYAALAFLQEDVHGRAVLPLARREPVGQEPGLRPRL